MRRVSQLADQRSHAVKLAVSKEGVEISASSPEYGEAKENIEKDYQGEAIRPAPFFPNHHHSNQAFGHDPNGLAGVGPRCLYKCRA